MLLLIVALVIYLQLTLMGGNLTSIILSLILFYRALNFLLVIQQSWQNFIQNTGAIQSITTLSASMETTRESYGTKAFHSLNDNIVIRNVSMSYGNKTVLNQLNLVIPEKQTIAFVGESGSGKTTLI